MRNQALIWNTDITPLVTSLTARLRGFAGIGAQTGDLHVSDLWAAQGGTAGTGSKLPLHGQPTLHRPKLPT
jgi:hypothetical protein